MAQYWTYLSYMSIGILMALLFTITYTLITPVRELRLIKQGNLACALSFGGALLGFCLAIGSAMIHSLDLANFILWAICAALVQILVYGAISRIIGNIGTQLAQNNIAVGALCGFLSLAIGILNAACLVD